MNSNAFNSVASLQRSLEFLTLSPSQKINVQKLNIQSYMLRLNGNFWTIFIDFDHTVQDRRLVNSGWKKRMMPIEW